MTVLVASDLDRTLIYSKAALGLTMPDAQAPRLLCVEVFEGRPQSFMTETAAGLFGGLIADPSVVFVPTTTRTRKQYERIHFPGAPAKYAICANGGQLLVDGVPDQDWRRRVADRLERECAPLAEVHDHLVAAADPQWLRAAWVAEELFSYLVVERTLVPADWVKALTAWAEERGWAVSFQGGKIYAVPRPLTKSAAMREVARRVGATSTLAAGDSLLDADLLLAADAAWRPGHGELADSAWTAPNVTALAEAGVLAGEEIVRALAREAGRLGTLEA